MPHFRLRFAAPAAVTADEAKSSFYWLADSRSSFTTALGPNLGSIGLVPARNIDLVRIAVAVFAADRSVKRASGGSNWNERAFELEVPVSDSAAWERVAPDLEHVLGFLTGDRWKLAFNQDEAPSESQAPKEISPRRVLLFSGGADSAVGALHSRSDLNSSEEHLLVSHFSATTLAPIQREIAERAETLLPGAQQHHLQFHFARKQRRLDGTKYPSEPSSRSRSLLFIALGLAVASMDEVPLWICENGFASLNPPLGPDRRGSLSTKTTHPAFLVGLSQVLQEVGAHNQIENPFADRTKGEMFRYAADLVGDENAGALLSATISCAHTGQRTFGISPTTSCGLCFGCVVRRASFLAAGLTDDTDYIPLAGGTELQRWLDSISTEPAIRSFIGRGVSLRDLIAMSLPESYSLSDARDLCARAIDELSGLLS